MKPAMLDPTTATPVLREYYSRVLAYMAIAATIAAGTYVQHFSFDILWIVPYALLYPHLAHHLSLRFPGERTDRILLGLDTFHAGAAVALLGFSVVPALKRGVFAVRNTTAHPVTVTISGQPADPPVVQRGKWSRASGPSSAEAPKPAPV